MATRRIGRKKAIKRTAIKRKKRSPSSFARIYGSKARVAWVKRQRCLIDSWRCEDPIENAHVSNGGIGRKADARHIVPLCKFHHRFLHEKGRYVFEDMYEINLDGKAAQTEAAWEAFLAGWDNTLHDTSRRLGGKLYDPAT